MKEACKTWRERKVHCSYFYVAIYSAQHETWTWSQLPENEKYEIIKLCFLTNATISSELECWCWRKLLFRVIRNEKLLNTRDACDNFNERGLPDIDLSCDWHNWKLENFPKTRKFRSFSVAENRMTEKCAIAFFLIQSDNSRQS